MSTKRAAERIPLLERIAEDQGILAVLDPKAPAAIAMVESGVGRNERRTFTSVRRSRTQPGTKYRFPRVPSQYCGEVQMGHMAGLDVGFDPVPMYRKGPDGHNYRVSWDTTRRLLGNKELAYTKFFEYMRRYEPRHEWEPRRMAILWKGGPGTLSKVNEIMAAEPGVPLEEAAKEAAALYLVPNVAEYLRRFDRDYTRLSAYVSGKKREKIRDGLERAGRALLWPVDLLRGVFA